MQQKAARAASGVLFIVAIVLLSVNTAGLVTSLRNDEIYSEKNTLFRDDITLTASEVRHVIAGSADDRRSYVTALNQAVNKGIAHYLWFDEGIDKYNLRVPFHENYVLFVASYILPRYYRKYEFRDYGRAIERGVGLCSQHAIIVAEILREKGIRSAIVSMPGHVVATARIDDDADEWWIVDADYGVVVPHGIEDIEKAPQIVAPYYRSRGYDERTVASLASIYGKKAKVYSEGAKNYGLKTYWAETASYVMIWIIPGVLMIPLVVTFRSGRPAHADRRFRRRRTVGPGEGSGTSVPG